MDTHRLIRAAVKKLRLPRPYYRQITFFKYMGSIQILDENDYEDIVASRRMFARKVIVGKSDRLVHMLHQREPVSRDDGGTMT